MLCFKGCFEGIADKLLNSNPKRYIQIDSYVKYTTEAIFCREVLNSWIHQIQTTIRWKFVIPTVYIFTSKIEPLNRLRNRIRLVERLTSYYGINIILTINNYFSVTLRSDAIMRPDLSSFVLGLIKDIWSLDYMVILALLSFETKDVTILLHLRGAKSSPLNGKGFTMAEDLRKGILPKNPHLSGWLTTAVKSGYQHPKNIDPKYQELAKELFDANGNGTLLS